MRKLIVLLALAAAVAAVSAQAASAESPDEQTTEAHCGIRCIPEPDPNDLPTPIEIPEIEDPSGPSDPPDPVDAVCTSRVKFDGADDVAELQTLIACPPKPAFNAGKVKLLRGIGVPKCDRRDDVIRLHYLTAPGGTSLRPTSGECLRDTDADGDQDVLYSVQL